MQVSHNILMKVKKGKGKKQSKSANISLLDPEDEQGKKKHVNRMRYFEDISSYSGVSNNGDRGMEWGKKKHINRMRYFEDISSYSGVSNSSGRRGVEKGKKKHIKRMRYFEKILRL